MVEPRRRSIVALLLLACALPLAGWWAVQARRAAPPVPAHDAATSPRRVVPTTTATGIATGIPAPRPALPLPAPGPPAAARCGEDQQATYQAARPDPVDGAIHVEPPVPDPDGVVRRLPGETRPAGAGYTGAMRRLDAALRASADPFDRAVADWLDLGQLTPPALRTAALVLDAVAADDARVYGLAYAACHPWLASAADGAASPPDGCARLSAGRWAELDPGNATPWIWALDDADRRGDAPAAREALRRIAAASRMDVHGYAGAAAVARVPAADADLAAQTTAAMQALAFPLPPASSLTTHCRAPAAGDADLDATCARIATLLYRRADSPIWRAVGGALHRLATGDAGWLDRIHRDQAVASAPPPADDATPCGGARALLRRFVLLDATGEPGLARPAAGAR